MPVGLAGRPYSCGAPDSSQLIEIKYEFSAKISQIINRLNSRIWEAAGMCVSCAKLSAKMAALNEQYTYQPYVGNTQSVNW